LPSLSGLPLNSDVNFGNVVEGHSRSLTLSVYNEDISTSTITTDAEIPFSIVSIQSDAVSKCSL